MLFPPMSIRIMIVDDEAPISRMLHALLQRFLSADVLSFNHPRAALDHFTADPKCADLLISDLKMSEMDGMELCGRVKAIRADLPIIILTAYAGDEIRDEAMRIGVVRLVQKPFETRSFVNMVKSLLPSGSSGNPPPPDPA